MKVAEEKRMEKTFTELIANSVKPVDWFKKPVVGVNEHRQAVAVLRHHDGMMKVMDLDEAVTKGYVAVRPAAGSFMDVTHFIVMLWNVTVLVQDKAKAAEAEPTMTRKQYEEMSKRKRQAEKEIDSYGLQQPEYKFNS
jgi:hypothetical protein